MKLLNFNLRCADDPNGHSIGERGFRIIDLIYDYDADICGFQEGYHNWERELKPLDQDFDHYYLYADTNQEFIGMWWRKDRYELVDTDHFWLSPTPDHPSKGWDGGFGIPRICVRVSLRELKSGKVIHYYNSHFDGSDISARESAQLIIHKAEELGRGEAVFCSADFNMTTYSPGWYSMRTFFKDVREEIAPENKQGTLCIYKEIGEDMHKLIDFIFYTGEGVQAKSYEVITRLYDGKFPSDHYGLIAEFDLEQDC